MSLSGHISELNRLSLMRPTLIVTALIAASCCARRALSAGPVLSRPPRSSANFGSPQRGIHISAHVVSQKIAPRGKQWNCATLGEEIETSPEDDPPATSQITRRKPSSDADGRGGMVDDPAHPVAEARWATMVSPPPQQTAPPDPPARLTSMGWASARKNKTHTVLWQSSVAPTTGDALVGLDAPDVAGRSRSGQSNAPASIGHEGRPTERANEVEVPAAGEA